MSVHIYTETIIKSSNINIIYIREIYLECTNKIIIRRIIIIINLLISYSCLFPQGGNIRILTLTLSVFKLLQSLDLENM